jgi:DNA-binding LacI/PurR family transcriptional regulator
VGDVASGAGTGTELGTEAPLNRAAVGPDRPPVSGDAHPPLQEVAARARVSISQVSRALAGKPGVSERTRRQIADAVAAWQQAQEPAVIVPAAETGMLGFLMPEHIAWMGLGTGVYVSVLEAIRGAAEAQGYGVIVATYSDAPGVRTLGDRLLAGRQVDGVIVTRTLAQDERFEKLRASGVPFVVINRLFDEPVHCVGVDHRRVGALATQHLLGLGHRRIALFSLPANITSMALRQEGYLQALRAAGVPADQTLLVPCADLTDGAAQDAARALVALDPRPTAVVLPNDRFAIAALGVWQAAGLRVPHDLSVVGADDSSEARAAQPPLTTVHIPWPEMAEIAVDALRTLRRHPRTRKLSVALDLDLVVRGSTSAPASR